MKAEGQHAPGFRTRLDVYALTQNDIVVNAALREHRLNKKKLQHQKKLSKELQVHQMVALEKGKVTSAGFKQRQTFSNQPIIPIESTVNLQSNMFVLAKNLSAKNNVYGQAEPNPQESLKRT